MRHELKIILDRLEDLLLDLEGPAGRDGFIKKVVDDLWVLFDKLEAIYSRERR
jgi:hypothetical protein